MIRLIRIELFRIFKHKSIYFIFIMISIFCFINNFLYKLDYDDDGKYLYDVKDDIDSRINELSLDLDKYDINNKDDLNIYITIKTKLDVLKGMKKYDDNSWQYIKYNDYLYSYLYDINYCSFILRDDNLINNYVNKYNDLIKYFDDDNWLYFLNLEKKELNDKLLLINNNIKNTSDKGALEQLYKNKKDIDEKLLIINYRLTKKINYGNNYLNRSLLEYQDDRLEIIKYRNKKLTFNDRVKYNILVNRMNVNKYIIDNQVNVNKENTLNFQLRNICNDYELFIVINILMVIGIMISEEFNKGTIKLLLIKPFNRNSILFSKFIVGIIMILITIIYLVLNELFMGGVLLGGSSLGVNVLVYDFNLNYLREFNVFIYMFIHILAKLPLFIMVLIIGLFFNLVVNNSIGSFSIVIFLYAFSAVINNFVINFKIKILKYIITLNWDFTHYLFGNVGDVYFLDIKKSFLIYLFYVIILLGVSFICFNKKNIKNI